jgi:small-conductance mechanosensitive channel
MQQLHHQHFRDHLQVVQDHHRRNLRIHQVGVLLQAWMNLMGVFVVYVKRSLIDCDITVLKNSYEKLIRIQISIQITYRYLLGEGVDDGDGMSDLSCPYSSYAIWRKRC